MTETDPEKRLIGYARVSTYGQTFDTQLSRAHLRRRRGSGISRLTDPTAVAQLWLRAGSLCPIAAAGPPSAKEPVLPDTQRCPGPVSAPHAESRNSSCSRKALLSYSSCL